MRIANVIFAFKDPSQLERLIKAMAHPQFDFYIHLDKKIDKTNFEYLSNLPQTKFINKRVVCNWGGFSLVKAMINSFDEIAATGVEYDFISLMSGQDYPIKPLDDIYNFFNEQRGYSFIRYDSSLETEWWAEAKFRYQHYHLTDFNFPGRYLLQRFLNFIIPSRNFYRTLKPYGGQVATWSTLSYDAAIFLSSYLRSKRSLRRYFSFTWACDEFAFITILMNSAFKDKVVNENCRYIVFEKGKSQPKILGISDYDKVTDSKMLFARKFDINVDTQILDKLDDLITSNK